MTFDKNARERIIEQLDSPGWRLVMEGMLRMIRSWSRDLLENPELEEGKRRGFVYARNAVIAGITDYYTTAGRELPSWLDQEFSYYREHTE